MPYIGNELAAQFQAFVTQTITGDGSTGYTLDKAVANGQSHSLQQWQVQIHAMWCSWVLLCRQ